MILLSLDWKHKPMCPFLPGNVENTAENAMLPRQMGCFGFESLGPHLYFELWFPHLQNQHHQFSGTKTELEKYFLF